jgi:hypothetical protein
MEIKQYDPEQQICHCNLNFLNEILNFLEENENGNTNTKVTGIQKSSTKREVYSHNCLH